MANKLLYTLLLKAVSSSDLTDILQKVELEDITTGKTIGWYYRERASIASGATKSVFPVTYTGTTLNYLIIPIYPDGTLLANQVSQTNTDAVGLVNFGMFAASMAATTLTIKNTSGAACEYDVFMFERSN